MEMFPNAPSLTRVNINKRIKNSKPKTKIKARNRNKTTKIAIQNLSLNKSQEVAAHSW